MNINNSIRLPMARSAAVKIELSALGALVACALTFPILASAQDTVEALESPPPLSADDLSRSVNDQSEQPALDTQPAEPKTDVDTATGDVITEYRVQERLYLIEVNPRLGGSYYLLDNDGDGSIDDYRQNAEADTNIGMWRIGSW